MKWGQINVLDSWIYGFMALSNSSIYTAHLGCSSKETNENCKRDWDLTKLLAQTTHITSPNKQIPQPPLAKSSAQSNVPPVRRYVVKVLVGARAKAYSGPGGPSNPRYPPSLAADREQTPSTKRPRPLFQAINTLTNLASNGYLQHGSMGLNLAFCFTSSMTHAANSIQLPVRRVGPKSCCFDGLKR